MKAAEWVTLLQDRAKTGDTLQAFFDEINDVATKRGGSLGAIEGSVKEQDRKFQAICRKAPELGFVPRMFDRLCRQYNPGALQAEQRFLQPRMKAVSHKKPAQKRFPSQVAYGRKSAG